MAENAPAPINARADRADALYRTGEAVAFSLSADSGDGGVFRWELSWDGAVLIGAGSIDVRPDRSAKVVATPDRPGFVRLKVFSSAAGADEKPVAEAAAAIDPERIAPTLPVPADFDAFWAAHTGEPGAFNAVITPHAEKPEGIISAVVLRDRGARGIGDVYGWLLRPHGQGPYPAVVRYHGAGIYAVGPENGLDWTARGVTVFSINPQSLPNDLPRERYVELREKEPLAQYRAQPDAFVRMFARATRAAEFVAELPDCDGRLIAEGHSQGGGQALAASALFPRMSALVLSCPTHCDHAGPLAERPAGWPKIVPPREDGAFRAEDFEPARYVDGVNFAARIACPTLVSICFLDSLCPPTGVYEAYNLLRGSKTARNDPFTGHIHTDACRDHAAAWVERFLGRA